MTAQESWEWLVFLYFWLGVALFWMAGERLRRAEERERDTNQKILRANAALEEFCVTFEYGATAEAYQALRDYIEACKTDCVGTDCPRSSKGGA